VAWSFLLLPASWQATINAECETVNFGIPSAIPDPPDSYDERLKRVRRMVEDMCGRGGGRAVDAVKRVKR